jgi:hypothetical protein
MIIQRLMDDYDAEIEAHALTVFDLVKEEDDRRWDDDSITGEPLIEIACLEANEDQASSDLKVLRKHKYAHWTCTYIIDAADSQPLTDAARAVQSVLSRRKSAIQEFVLSLGVLDELGREATTER